ATFRPRVCVSSSLKLWKISISPNSEEIHRQPPGGHKCLLKSSPAIQPRLPPDLPRSRAGRYPHTARVRLPPRRSLHLPYTDLRVTLARSEEHTSELQSRENIVCRLLLEKKNKKKVYST